MPYAEDYYIRVLLNKIKLQELMSDKVISIKEDEPFSHVAEKLEKHGIRHLPVVDENYKLTGMVTQRDLFRTCSPRRDEDGSLVYDFETLDTYILKEVMTRNPASLTPVHSLADALILMADKKYGAIPLVDKFNSLVGIITQTDIFRLWARILREGGASGPAR